MMADPPSRTLPREAIVRHKRDFQAVFATRQACRTGPLVVHAGRNTVGRCRLGLAVPRAVGNAPQRNRIKRLLREAFRHVQHQLPNTLDLVIVVRPHDPQSPDAYADLLVSAAGQLTARSQP